MREVEQLSRVGHLSFFRCKPFVFCSFFFCVVGLFLIESDIHRQQHGCKSSFLICAFPFNCVYYAAAFMEPDVAMNFSSGF